jgi:protocatechuate 3,4-dioxygenase alpha subunit
MVQPLPYLKETPSQTAGPYVHIGLTPEASGHDMGVARLGAVIAGPDAPGERVRIALSVLDGLDVPVRDAVVEVWQADAAGRHEAAGDFRGWGRFAADPATGDFAFETVKPGRAGGQAPHLTLWIVARGINTGLQTRLYFPDDDHAGDPVLSRLEPARRATLIAAATGPGAFRLDVRLQGARETVFLDM